MVEWQSGRFVDSLPLASESIWESDSRGVLESLDGQIVGQAVIELGGGKKHKDDRVDHLVGFEMLVRLGDTVQRGQPLVRIFARTQADHERAKRVTVYSSKDS